MNYYIKEGEDYAKRTAPMLVEMAKDDPMMKVILGLIATAWSAGRHQADIDAFTERLRRAK